MRQPHDQSPCPCRRHERRRYANRRRRHASAAHNRRTKTQKRHFRPGNSADGPDNRNRRYFPNKRSVCDMQRFATDNQYTAKIRRAAAHLLATDNETRYDHGAFRPGAGRIHLSQNLSLRIARLPGPADRQHQGGRQNAAHYLRRTHRDLCHTHPCPVFQILLHTGFRSAGRTAHGLYIRIENLSLRRQSHPARRLDRPAGRRPAVREIGAQLDPLHGVAGGQFQVQTHCMGIQIR